MPPRKGVANEDRDEEAAANHPSAKDTRELRAALFASRRLSHARRVIEAKRESRRNRRSLKESGDYLGVQGINPETGELDIVTPSDSEQSTGGLEIEQKVDALRRIIQNSPSSQATTKARAEREIKRILAKEHDRLRKLEREKEALKRANSNVRWRRQTKQWSSAQEPNLSPIAQSHMNMASSSQQSVLDEQAPLKGKLIDLSTSKSLQRVLQATAAHGNTSTERSGSSGTVIRTPHRQSTVDLPTAAQELFENGISFDNLDQPSDSNASGLLNAVSESLFNAASNPAVNIDEAHSPHQLRPKPLPILKITPPKNTATPPELKETGKEECFLDLRAADEADPGGLRQKANASSPASATYLSPSTSQQLLPSKARLSGASLESQRKTSLAQTEEMLKSFARDLTSISKKSRLIMLSPESTSPRSLERKCLAECDLSFLLANERNGLGESPSTMTSQGQVPGILRQDGTGDTACGERFQALTQGHPVKNPRLDQREIPLTKDEIRGDLKALEGRLAQIDRPKKRTMLKDRHPGEVDQNWGQDAIRDITNKDNEVMEVSASITITTTTGSDPKMSPSAQSQGQSKGNASDPPRRRNLGPLTWNLPKKRFLVDSLESLQSSQTNRTPNTSPSPAPTVDTPAIDTTSAKQIRQTLVSKPAHEPKADVATDGSPYIRTSHMFMSMIRQDGGKKDAKVRTQQEPLAISLKKEVDKEALPIQHQVPSSEPKIDMIERKSSGRRREQRPPPPPPQSAERRRVCTDTNKAAKDLSVQVPGSYPTHLGAEGAIANLSNASLLETSRKDPKAESAGLWEATKEVSHKVQATSAWLLKLYWATIRPIFKADSEYWARNARNETTCKDFAIMVLAFPIAFLGLVGLI
ncbi:Fc.00g087790.m01.CDS01 [Cosmosporella sp. VM-42]